MQVGEVLALAAVHLDLGRLVLRVRHNLTTNGELKGLKTAAGKAGIMLDDLVAAELRPRTLFEEGTEKRERLMTAIDAISDRFGKFSAVPAAQGFRREWRARADSRSPAWTTRIAEVPVVSASC